MQKSEQLLYELLARAPLVAFAIDVTGRFQFCCGRLLEAAGAATEDLRGTSLFTRWGEHRWLTDGVRRALSGESLTVSAEVNGAWMELQLLPLTDPRGRVVGAAGLGIERSEKRRLDRLQKSALRLAVAERVAHFGTWEWEVVSNRVHWSDELFRIFGVARDQFDGTYEAFLAMIHPDDRDRVRGVIERAFTDAQPFRFEHRVLRAGSVRHLHCSGEVTTKEGKPVRMLGVAHDFTEMKETERALEHSLSIVSSALDCASDGILVVDRGGRITAYNRKFIQMWRLPRAIVETRDDERAVAFVLDQLQRPDEFMRRVRELYRSPEAESQDVLAFKDGRIFERYSQPQWLDGTVVGRVWSFRDVTPQRAAERERDDLIRRELAVRHAAQLGERRAAFLADASRMLASLDYEAALSSVARCVTHSLADWCIIDLVDGAETRRIAVAHGDRRADDLAGRLRGAPEAPPGAGEVVHRGRAAIFQANTQESALSPLLREVGVGSYMAVPIAFRGTTLGVITMMRCRNTERYEQADLTLAEELASRAALAIENARLYEGVQGAVELRERFLSVASHELRGPIAALQLSVDGLRRGLDATATPKALAIIERQMQRLKQLLNELLDVGRMRADRLSLESEDCDLGELVRFVVARSEQEISRSHSEVVLAIEAGVVGKWDRSRLDQVIANLLSNALKFGAGKPVEINVSRDADRARFVVRDHGIGIPEDRLAQIFDPFQRAVSEKRYAGLGLGLYIVRTIVEALGGQVSVDSRPGAGATFVVELPLAAARLS